MPARTAPKSKAQLIKALNRWFDENPDENQASLAGHLGLARQSVGRWRNPDDILMPGTEALEALIELGVLDDSWTPVETAAGQPNRVTTMELMDAIHETQEMVRKLGADIRALTRAIQR